MARLVCVGGCAAGMRKEVVDGESRVTVAVLRPIVPRPRPLGSMDLTFATTQEYRKERIRTPEGDEIAMLVPEGSSFAEAMVDLLETYALAWGER